MGKSNDGKHMMEKSLGENLITGNLTKYNDRNRFNNGKYLITGKL